MRHISDEHTDVIHFVYTLYALSRSFRNSPREYDRAAA
jgi:hypothetical protein